jgi:hypothetical protein
LSGPHLLARHQGQQAGEGLLPAFGHLAAVPAFDFGPPVLDFLPSPVELFALQLTPVRSLHGHHRWFSLAPSVAKIVSRQHGWKKASLLK